MARPYFKNKHRFRGTVSAKEIFLKSNNVNSLSELPEPPKSCIICPSDFIVDYLRKSYRMMKGPKIINNLYFLNKDIAVFTGFIGFGAPMWVWALEQLIAYGIKDFIYIGFFGSVNEHNDHDRLFVIDKALRDEGTSLHYSADSKWAYPDKGLTEQLMAGKGTIKSSIWTTDAMFRQTKDEIRLALNERIIGFDMETSALFTVAKAKKCRIASIQVMSDSYIKNEWNAVYGTRKFFKELSRAVDLAVRSLGNH